MSPAFSVNYVTGRRQITNVKVGKWLSETFFWKKCMSRNNSRMYMFVCTTVMYEYTNALRDDVYNLFVMRELEYIWGFITVFI